MTLLNSQKSYEQKIEEANQVAEKWEKTTSATDHENLQKKQEGMCLIYRDIFAFMVNSSITFEV